jgi:hypothetical protein
MIGGDKRIQTSALCRWPRGDDRVGGGKLGGTLRSYAVQNDSQLCVPGVTKVEELSAKIIAGREFGGVQRRKVA